MLFREIVTEFQRFGNEKLVYNVHLLLHVATTVQNWGPFWVHSGYQFEAWNRKIVDFVKSANDRASQIVDRFLLAKYLEDALLDDTIVPEAREIMREHLQKARWNIPPIISSGCSFAGTKIINNNALERPEIVLIQNAGYNIAQNAQVTRYDSAQIHGITFKVRDDENRRYCNYFAYTTNIMGSAHVKV